MSKLARIFIVLSVLPYWIPQPTTGANNGRHNSDTRRPNSDTPITADLIDSRETDVNGFVSPTSSRDPTTERLQYDALSPDPQLMLKKLLVPPTDIALDTETTMDTGKESAFSKTKNDEGLGRKYPEDRIKNVEYDYQSKEYRRQVKDADRQYNHQDKNYGPDDMEYSRQHKEYDQEDKGFRHQNKDYKYQDNGIQYSHQNMGYVHQRKEYNNQDKDHSQQGNILEEHQDMQEKHQDVQEGHRGLQEEHPENADQRHDKLDHQISWRVGYSDSGYRHGYWYGDHGRRLAEQAVPERYADGSIKQRRANPGLFSFSPCETWLGTGYRETCCMGRWLDWPTCLCYGFNACLSDSQSDQ